MFKNTRKKCVFNEVIVNFLWLICIDKNRDFKSLWNFMTFSCDLVGLDLKRSNRLVQWIRWRVVVLDHRRCAVSPFSGFWERYWGRTAPARTRFHQNSTNVWAGKGFFGSIRVLVSTFWRILMVRFTCKGRLERYLKLDPAEMA